jgi:hypothetical protein
MHRPILVWAALFAVTLAAPARADVVELVDGGLFEGTVTRAPGAVRVRTSSGSSLDFEEAQVREVRRGGWREEYLRRRGAARAGGPDEHYRLALWCGSKGLAAEQDDELAAALAIDPDHQASRDRLEALRAVRRPAPPGPAPDAPPAPAALLRHETAHVRAAADGGEELVRKVAETAEAVVADFAELFEVPAGSTAVRDFRVRVRYYSRRSDYEEVRRAAGVGGGSGFFSPMTGECHIACEPDGRAPGMAVRQTIRHEVAHALTRRVLGVESQRRWLIEALAAVMEGSDTDGLGGGMIWTRLSMVPRGAGSAGCSVAALLDVGTGGPMSLEDYARVWSFAHFIFYGDDARERARLLAPRRDDSREALAALGRTRKETFLAMLAEIRAAGARADVDGLFGKHFPDREALEAAWADHLKRQVETRLQPVMMRQPFIVRRVPAPEPAAK